MIYKEIEKLEYDINQSDQKVEELKPLFNQLKELQRKVNIGKDDINRYDFGTINRKIESALNKVSQRETKRLLGNGLGRVKMMDVKNNKV